MRIAKLTLNRRQSTWRQLMKYYSILTSMYFLMMLLISTYNLKKT
jgi:hypothetical protein